jgi:hypothetical protein
MFSEVRREYSALANILSNLCINDLAIIRHGIIPSFSVWTIANFQVMSIAHRRGKKGRRVNAGGPSRLRSASESFQNDFILPGKQA